MSVGLKLICYDCGVSAYIGTWNTEMVEHPKKVGKFIWKHSGHNLGTITDGGEFQDSYLEGWPEDEELDEYER